MDLVTLQVLNLPSVWGNSTLARGKLAKRNRIGIYTSWDRCCRVGKPVRVRGSRICTRIFSRGPLSWCSCHSSIVGLGSVCRSSCWACSSSLPSVLQLRRDRLVWILRLCLPRLCSSRCCYRREVQARTAIVEFVHFLIEQKRKKAVKVWIVVYLDDEMHPNCHRIT